MNPPMNWVPVILVCPVLACSGFVVWFCVLFGFGLCAFAVCLVYDDDGPMDYVQVLPQFSFAALNSRWPGTLICITAHAMPYSVVNDLAKAMKALDGKRKVCENKTVAILNKMQQGKTTLIKKDGGEMLIAIVLDKPLSEAQALVDNPDAFMLEITKIIQNKHAHRCSTPMCVMICLRQNAPLPHRKAEAAT